MLFSQKLTAIYPDVVEKRMPTITFFQENQL